MREYTCPETFFAELCNTIRRLMAERNHVIVGIDGRCTAGKTTLGAALQKEFDCNLFHMDDFFLPPAMRTPERLAQPGGNFDRERFSRDLFRPLRDGKSVKFSRFDCATCTFEPEKEFPPRKLSIIEGVYALHPVLLPDYDLTVFLDLPKDVQLARVGVRNGERAEIFRTKWIPLEERYFDHFGIRTACDFLFMGSDGVFPAKS